MSYLKLSDFLQQYQEENNERVNFLCLRGTAGGKFNIPERERETLYKILTSTNKPFHLVEKIQKDNPFKFFMDIDGQNDTETLTKEKKQCLSANIQKLFKTVYVLPKDFKIDFKFLSNNKKPYKCRLYTNMPVMVEERDYIIDRLREHNVNFDYADIHHSFDKPSSLRMIYASKIKVDKTRNDIKVPDNEKGLYASKKGKSVDTFKKYTIYTTDEPFKFTDKYSELKNKKKQSARTTNYPINKNIDISELLNALSDNVCDEYYSWMMVCKALINLHYSVERIKDWSETSDKYDGNAEALIQKWYDDYNIDNPYGKSNKYQKGYDIGVIIHFVKKSNPEKYKEILLDAGVYGNNRFITGALQGGHMDLAKCFMDEMSKHNLKITYERGDKVYGYMFDTKTKLYTELTSEHLIGLIQNVLLKRIIKFHEEVKDMVDDDDEEETTDEKENKKNKDNDKLDMYLKGIKKLICNIKSINFITNIKTNLISMCQSLAFKNEINNPASWNIPIKDGKIIDLKTLIVRERTMDDYWTFELSRSYTKKQDRAIEYFTDLMKQNMEKAVCLIKYLGYSISPNMKLKLMILCVGDADTGKSTLFSIMSKVFSNNIVCPINDRAIFNNKSESVHNDEAMVLKRARVVLNSENKKGLHYNEGFLKHIIGGDPFSLRGCGKTTEEFKTTAKVVGQANDYPVHSGDKSFTDKLLYCMFENVYKKTTENVVKIERLKNDDEFLDQFFSLLLYAGREVYTEDEFIIPKCMLEVNEKLAREFNSIEQFIKDKIELKGDCKGDDNCPLFDNDDYYIEQRIIYPSYIQYCKDNDMEPEGKIKLLDKIKKQFGEETRKYIKGKRIRVIDGIKIKF